VLENKVLENKVLENKVLENKMVIINYQKNKMVENKPSK